MKRDLSIVTASLMLWGLGEGMFYSFQPIYLQQLGANPLQIGTILGMVGLAMMVAHIPAGYLADRVGRRPLMIAAWILGTLATILMAMAKSLPVYVGGTIFYGLTAFVVGPMNGYITNARGKWSVARTLTTISAFYNIGSIVGPLLGGWIGGQAGLRRTFFFSALIFIASTIILFFTRPQPIEPHAAGEPKPGVRNILTGPFALFLAIFTFSTFVMYFPQPLAVNFLKNERSINLDQIGQLLSLRSVGIVLFNLLLGQLNPRLGYMLSQVSMGAFSLVLWLGNGLPWYALSFLLLGSFSTARSMAIAQGRALVRAAEMSVAYGLIETANAIALILSPPLAGLIYEHNSNWIFPIGLTGTCMALVVVFILMPHFKAQE